MLSFCQWLCESDQIGFLHSKRKPVLGNYDNDGESTHHAIAVKRKLTTVRHETEDNSPADDAMRKGFVRFYHHPSEKEAGYEFHNTPANRRVVRDHMAQHGKLSTVYVDMKNKNGTHSSHQFDSMEDAHRHLSH